MKTVLNRRAQSGAQFLLALAVIMLAALAVRSCDHRAAREDDRDYTPAGLR